MNSIHKKAFTKNDEKRQIERTTKGSTLLSGNVYCAHCGNKMISTSYIDRYDRADGTQYKVRRQRYICTNKAMHRGACDGQSAYVAQRIDGAVIEILKSYLSMIKSTPKDIALERRYQSEITGLKKKTGKVIERNRENQKTGRGIIGRNRQVADRGEQIYSRYAVCFYRSNERITASERNRTA